MLGVLNKPVDWLRNLGSVVVVATPIVGVLWFFFSLEGRVRSIEAQLQQIHTAPAIDVGSGPIQNPLQSACAKIALDANEMLKSSQRNSASYLQDLAKELGCTLK
jgi:hypothetical protein